MATKEQNLEFLNNSMSTLNQIATNPSTPKNHPKSPRQLPNNFALTSSDDSPSPPRGNPPPKLAHQAARKFPSNMDPKSRRPAPVFERAQKDRKFQQQRRIQQQRSTRHNDATARRTLPPVIELSSDESVRKRCDWLDEPEENEDWSTDPPGAAPYLQPSSNPLDQVSAGSSGMSPAHTKPLNKWLPPFDPTVPPPNFSGTQNTPFSMDAFFAAHKRSLVKSPVEIPSALNISLQDPRPPTVCVLPDNDLPTLTYATAVKDTPAKKVDKSK